MSTRTKRWFLQPQDDHTNKAFAGDLDPDVNASREIAKDGPYDVYEASYESVRKFVLSKTQGYKFLVYRRIDEGPFTQIPDQEFLLVKSAAQKAVKKLLKKVRRPQPV